MIDVDPIRLTEPVPLLSRNISQLNNNREGGPVSTRARMVVLVTSLMTQLDGGATAQVVSTLWRQRYGDEFVDLMEQSIADRPHNAKRTSNIIVKSFKVVSVTLA